MTLGEKQEASGETFSKNSPFFIGGGEEVRVSILRGWTLRHSRRGCHFNILRPPRMGGKRCDNPLCEPALRPTCKLHPNSYPVGRLEHGDKSIWVEFSVGHTTY